MSKFDITMSEEKKASLELVEESRETEWKHPSYLGELYQGKIRWELITPFPEQSLEDKKTGDDFLAKLEDFLKKNVNPEEIDETSQIPEHVIKGLGELGAFGIKIPKEYGGMGLSQVNYSRAMHLVTSYCGSTGVFLSAHQSIGVPQPLILFGTEEQKRKYLPRFAKGEISAFALTESEAGSDPQRISTTAIPTKDGKYYLLNGKKLWCTNGVVADIIIVIAVTPPKIVRGKEKKQLTAFIVETNTPGFSVEHRCSFMGLHGIQNGIICFKDVKVPRDNIILGEGQGLKLALTTLNTGRLIMSAASTGMGKWCLNVARRWAGTRKQWGSVIGEHESISSKLGVMASNVFAMDAMTWMVAHMADAKKTDIRLESSVSKLFCTEAGWRIVDDAVQIRGGCGYETSFSLKKRGETHFPIERVMRDARVNLIIEGTSEMMHLFIAREALDPHMNFIKPLFHPKTSTEEKLRGLFHMFVHYVTWYPLQWLPVSGLFSFTGLPMPMKKHMIYVSRRSKKLARNIFLKMVRYQKKLEAKQNILNRIVDIGTDLFAMSCACSYAVKKYKKNKECKNSMHLADLFCRQARERIDSNFKRLCCNYDKQNKKVAKDLLAGTYEWIEKDIIPYELTKLSDLYQAKKLKTHLKRQ